MCIKYDKRVHKKDEESSSIIEKPIKKKKYMT